MIDKLCKITAVLLGVILFSCESEKPNTITRQERTADAIKNSDIDTYLYLDNGDCIHAEQNCYGLNIGFSDTNIYVNDGNAAKLAFSYGYSLRRIKLSDLSYTDVYRCCKYCIDDAVYEALLSRIRDRHKKDPFGE